MVYKKFDFHLTNNVSNDTSYEVDVNHSVQLLLAVYICSCFVHFPVVLFLVLYHSLYKGEFIFMIKNITYKVMVTNTPYTFGTEIMV